KNPKFKIGGDVDNEQRQFFKDASKEIRELGLKVAHRNVKKKSKVDDLKSSGRKVKKSFVPFKKAKETHRVEKEKQDKLISEAILRGEKPILQKKKKEEKSDEPSLKIGKFSNGTLLINKQDIKTVYNSGKRGGKGNSRGGKSSGGRGGRGGGGGGRGGGGRQGGRR
ncbi:hypothetical protein DICPUDRAFT_27567, partial [Dictyostelium purpureum]